MLECLANQRVWRGFFVLGCVTIAATVMQFVIIGSFYTASPSARQKFLISMSRVYNLAGSDVYITNNYHTENSSELLDSRIGRDIQLKDDVFLEWKENRMALSVFIFSAISTNTPSQQSKHVIKLTGWEALKHRRYVPKCCVLWKNNKTSFHEAPNRTYWKESRLAATQYSCPIRGSPRDVQGVTLEFNRKACPRDKLSYNRPFLPVKQKQGSFAICAKIVYGNIDHKLLIDWVEYYRELRVDKIIMFAYNVTGPALRVLKHYSMGKLVEIRLFNFPWKTGGLKRDVGVKNSNAFQDEQVVVFDCYERLRDYTYIAIVDLDEFILPKQNRHLKDMMASLQKQYPNSAGFTLKSYMFIKNWTKVGANNGSDIVQYYRRTGAVNTRHKNVFLPDRVVDGSVCTHEFTPKPEYNRTFLPDKFAVIHHYRYSYPHFERIWRGNPVLDHSIDRIVKKIRSRTSTILQTVMR